MKLARRRSIGTFPNQKRLRDAADLRLTHNEKANELVKPRRRKGWELKGVAD